MNSNFLHLATQRTMLPFQASWGTLLISGMSIVVVYEVFSRLFRGLLGGGPPGDKRLRLEGKRRMIKYKKKKFVTPAWAVRKAEELTPPVVSDERLKNLNERKPPNVWNTVLFFPDLVPTKVNSPMKQLMNYFVEAKTSIYLCMYLCSHHELRDVIVKKFREGLLVQVVTDLDTWTAHNNKGIKFWRKQGIEVYVNANGYLMHNKFAIIDEEAVLTGSLNWTRQGVYSNNENVMITTDPRIVARYMEEFRNLWSKSRVDAGTL